MSCFETRGPVGEVGSIFGGVTVDAPRGLALSLIGRPSDPTMRLALWELAELALSMVGGKAVEADEPRGMLMIGSPSDPRFLELLRRIDIAGADALCARALSGAVLDPIVTTETLERANTDHSRNRHVDRV